MPHQQEMSLPYGASSTVGTMELVIQAEAGIGGPPSGGVNGGHSSLVVHTAGQHARTMPHASDGV